MADNSYDNGPTGNGREWGVNSKQAHPDYPLGSTDNTPRGWHNKHTDVDEIRRKFGIPQFDIGDFQNYEKPYANCLIHTVDGKYFGHAGGTNALAVGEKGSGKSTLGKHVAIRVMDDAARLPGWAIPDEDPAVPDGENGIDDDDDAVVSLDPDAVVWRGQPAASEWLPMKKWTTLHLPRNASVDATWEPNDMRQKVSEEADLEDVVREVKYYDDPRDVNEALEPGTFNVVYPDPSFTGCEAIMLDSDYCDKRLPFTPKWNATNDQPATPLVHWWFAYLTARLEYGPYDWTTVVFDEAADLAPEGATSTHETHAKVKALRKIMAHSRKHYLTLVMFAHHEANVHHKVRRTFNWRINMPDGTANPCDSNNDTAPVGFNNIPMIADMLSDKDVGFGLWWNEQNFTRFTWDDFPDWEEDDGRWLKISTGEPQVSRRVTAKQSAGVNSP